MITTQKVTQALAVSGAFDGMPIPLSDPPTASEECLKILIVEMLLLLYYETPDDVGPPGTQPRDLWDGMLGSSHAEKVGAAVALLWP